MILSDVFFVLQMPIGVPRIIYCWGEELPAQWTDIYNFIFRRRMVFLMQYLDDELCNQICGLLINIHMEDRSKELEKKEMEKSGLFKSGPSRREESKQSSNDAKTTQARETANQWSATSDVLGSKRKDKASKSVEDLLGSEEDLAIDDNYTLEQYTLQKITMEWLNWNANFYDYADEPYLFYLAEILSKDFTKENGNLLFSSDSNEMSQLMKIFKTVPSLKGHDRFLAVDSKFFQPKGKENFSPSGQRSKPSDSSEKETNPTSMNFSPLAVAPQPKLRYKRDQKNLNRSHHFDVYSPFRLLANFVAKDYSLKKLKWNLENKTSKNAKGFLGSQTEKLIQQLRNISRFDIPNESSKQLPEVKQTPSKRITSSVEKSILPMVTHDLTAKLLEVQAEKNFLKELNSHKQQLSSSQKALGQRRLKHEYNLEKLVFSPTTRSSFQKKKNLSTEGLASLVASEGLAPLSTREKPSVFVPTKLTLPTNPQEKTLNYLDFNTLGQVSTPSRPSSSQRSMKSGIMGSFSSEANRAGRTTQTESGSQKDLSASEARQLKNSNDYREYYRKQTERSLQEEESKKVFVIINSFGGSVGNGITVHDALQFIKAGSLTLALGVAASAASLALAGGTIGERYVTEGCHVMIHQPEGGLNGQASDIWIDSQEIMKIRLDVAEIYSLSTYRPRHKILRDLDRDFYLTAMETIYYGLADEIATNEVMHEIIEMTSKVWDYHDSKQQRLLETRESASSGLDTQAQN